MSAIYWMKFAPGDYVTDTMGLSTIHHGAYILTICAYWLHGGPLPDDDDRLRHITHLDTQEWSKAKQALLQFFTPKDGHWHHDRIDAELLESGKRYQQKIDASEAASKARKSKPSGPSGGKPSGPSGGKPSGPSGGKPSGPSGGLHNYNHNNNLQKQPKTESEIIPIEEAFS